MMAQPVFLWPGGPSLPLGSYLITFKLLFALLFVAWALGLLRAQRRAWLLGGCIGLASFAWLALDLPLQRPYGVDDGLPGLFELAQPMVAASRASSGESWMVGQENPRALWSFLLALASGFDPTRLLALYPWIPLVSLVFLVLALDWGLASIAGGDRREPSAVAQPRSRRSDRDGGGAPARQEEPGIARALAVFFVLFLSSDQLSVHHAAGPLWPRVFWLEPRVAFALGVLAAHLRLLGSTKRAVDVLLAGASLAVVFWLDPRLGGCALGGGLVWLVFWGGSGPKWKPALSLALGAALGLGWWSQAGLMPAKISQEMGSWGFVARQVLSLSRHGGLVFLLGVLGVVRMSRSQDRSERLMAGLVASATLLWSAACFSSRAAAIVDLRLMDTYLRVLLAAAAGFEAHRLLLALQSKIDAAPEARRVSLAVFVGLALPWSFPYWWHPVRYDSIYAKSLTPISRQVQALGDWIRAEIPRDAVFVAGQSYAAWIPALTGRQVLLVEGWPPPRDVASRRRAESWFIESQDPQRIRSAASDWRLTHLAWGRLDAERDVEVDYGFFESSPLFRKVWQQGRWVRVFALRPRLP